MGGAADGAVEQLQRKAGWPEALRAAEIARDAPQVHQAAVVQLRLEAGEYVDGLLASAGAPAVLEAVKVVWASLWSDAALLYRRELGLDPARSRMAVLVHAMVSEDRSGVAFVRDPRQLQSERAIVEAVPGLCADLLGGRVDPDRWILERSSGKVVEWRRGVRGAGDPDEPLLAVPDLAALHQALGRVEALFGWPPDVEWTGRAPRLTLLQSRPITTAGSAEPGDKRAWYLTLRPGPGAFWGLVAGMASSILMFLAVKFSWIDVGIITLSNVSSDMAANFWRAWWPWLVCFVVTVGLSLFTKRKPKEELEGLVRGLTRHESSEGIPLVRRPEFYAVISVIVLVILNIYFW